MNLDQQILEEIIKYTASLLQESISCRSAEMYVGGIISILPYGNVDDEYSEIFIEFNNFISVKTCTRSHVGTWAFEVARFEYTDVDCFNKTVDAVKEEMSYLIL